MLFVIHALFYEIAVKPMTCHNMTLLLKHSLILMPFIKISNYD